MAVNRRPYQELHATLMNIAKDSYDQGLHDGVLLVSETFYLLRNTGDSLSWPMVQAALTRILEQVPSPQKTREAAPFNESGYEPSPMPPMKG